MRTRLGGCGAVGWLVHQKLVEYGEAIGEIRDGIKCVYSPSMADLCSPLFECVVIDEGVKM